MTVLRLHVEGERGTILFKNLVETFSYSLAVLKELDSAISEEPRGALDWFVRDLSANGNLVAEIIALPKSGKYEDKSKQVALRFVDGLGVIEREPGVPPFFSEGALSNVEKLANLLGKGGAMGFGARQIGVRTQARITHRAAINAGQAIKPVFSAVGSVTGMLEAINLHGRPKFNVYEAVTGSAVRCSFDRDKHLELIRRGLGKRVRACGVIYRNARGDALRLDMQDLDILPQDRELACVRDIYGIDPDFTGSQSSDEYVRWLREA